MMMFLCGSAIAQDNTDIIGHVRLDSSRNTWHATLACNDSGLWFCAWTERTQAGASIRGAFLQRGQRQDLNLIDVSRPAPGMMPAAGRDEAGEVVVAWQDYRITRKRPAIVMDEDGWYLVIWHQGEEGAFNLAGQWFHYPAEREGANFCLTCENK